MDSWEASPSNNINVLVIAKNKEPSSDMFKNTTTLYSIQLVFEINFLSNNSHECKTPSYLKFFNSKK